MKKSIISLMVGGLFASSAALAITGTFSVDIDMQNNTGNLTLVETTTMAFPTIVVDESTKAGAKCNTNWIENELCRNSTHNTPARHAGVYEITGSLLAPISLTLSGAATANGMQFTPTFANNTVVSAANHTLDNTGKVSDGVGGLLELVDPTAVVSQVTTFTYDVTAAYN